MSSQHHVLFRWPHPGPNVVIVTGTFDQWSASRALTKGPHGFEGSVSISWDEKIAYKFIVDGRWMVKEDQPTETDRDGNINNVYKAPPKPQDGVVEQPSDHKLEVDSIAPAKLKRVVPTAHSEPEVVSRRSSFQLVSDLANTVAARVGTSSSLGYVASGLGAAINSVVGVDPINAGQIAIPPPKPDGGFDVPESQAEALEPPAAVHEPELETPVVEQPSVLPTVPVVIVPVNARENNTTGEPAVDATERTAPRLPRTEISTHGPPIVVGHNTEQGGIEQTISPTENGVPVPVEPVISPDAQQEEKEMSLTPADSTKTLLEAGPVTENTAETAIPEVIVATPVTTEVTASAVTIEEPAEVASEVPLVSGEHIAPADQVVNSTGNDVAPPLSSTVSREPIEGKLATVSPEDAPTAEVPPQHETLSTLGAPIAEAAPEVKRQEAASAPVSTVAATAEVPPPYAPAAAAAANEPIRQFTWKSKIHGSPSSSKSSTAASRKKKVSLFGKLKSIFSHDKEKEKK